jgi:HEAT repeat protein
MSHEDDVRQALKAHPISKTVAERAARDPEYAEYIRKVQAATQPILDDLARIGYKVESLYELRHQGKSWESSIPVLLHWLPLIHIRNLKDEIIACLAVPWTGNRATEYLIQEFKDTAVSDPYSAWAIGNALSIVDVKGHETEIIRLCRNPNYGMARQMMVMNLHRLRKFPEAEETALDLLEQEDVKLHAIIALGRMKSKRALFQLEKLLTEKRPHIRKEARKAITKIMR